MTSKGRRISDPKAVEALIAEMLRRPPISPADLQRWLETFDPASVRREMTRTLMQTTLSAEDEFQLVQWLVELNPEGAAIRLIEAVGDVTLPFAKRALAVIVLTGTHERELHKRISMVGREQQIGIMLAAQQWLQGLQERESIAPRSPAKRRTAVVRRQAVSRAGPSRRICRLKVTLRDIRPAIFRRIEVRDDITLERLHDILQVAMGWTDSHLHAFHVRETTYGVPDREWPDDTVSEKKMTLRSLIENGVKRFQYDYDFGDDWSHDILIERTTEPEAGVKYPRCLAGKRACPPEDCGGAWGYAELLEILADPGHPEHAERLDWTGGHFDAEEFDLDRVNRELRRVR